MLSVFNASLMLYRSTDTQLNQGSHWDPMYYHCKAVQVSKSGKVKKEKLGQLRFKLSNDVHSLLKPNQPTV